MFVVDANLFWLGSTIQKHARDSLGAKSRWGVRDGDAPHPNKNLKEKIVDNILFEKFSNIENFFFFFILKSSVMYDKKKKGSTDR